MEMLWGPLLSAQQQSIGFPLVDPFLIPPQPGNGTVTEGRYTWPNGDYYEGEFQNNVMHGIGVYHYVKTGNRSPRPPYPYGDQGTGGGGSTGEYFGRKIRLS